MKTNVTIVNDGGEEYYKTPGGDLVVVGRVKLEIGEANQIATPNGDRVKVVSGEKVYCQTPNSELVCVKRFKLDNGGEKRYVNGCGEIFYVTKDGGLARKNVDGAQYDIVDCYERGYITLCIDAKVKLDENAVVNVGKQVIRSLQNRLDYINKIKNAVNEYNAGVDEANRIGIVIVETGGHCHIPSEENGKTDSSGKSLSVHVNYIGEKGFTSFAQCLCRVFAQHCAMLDWWNNNFYTCKYVRTD
jgi:hypothetical protein